MYVYNSSSSSSSGSSSSNIIGGKHSIILYIVSAGFKSDRDVFGFSKV
jgi:hypothetical protein